MNKKQASKICDEVRAIMEKHGIKKWNISFLYRDRICSETPEGLTRSDYANFINDIIDDYFINSRKDKLEEVKE